MGSKQRPRSKQLTSEWKTLTAGVSKGMHAVVTLSLRLQRRWSRHSNTLVATAHIRMIGTGVQSALDIIYLFSKRTLSWTQVFKIRILPYHSGLSKGVCCLLMLLAA